MPATIPSMPEANAAYQASLSALRAAHTNLDGITNPLPGTQVDWTAYNAGLAACTACQNSAQASLSVFQAAILNTSGVQELISKLVADTQAMNDSAKVLDKTAATLSSLATIAATTTAILTTILKFV